MVFIFSFYAVYLYIILLNFVCLLCVYMHVHINAIYFYILSNLIMLSESVRLSVMSDSL